MSRTSELRVNQLFRVPWESTKPQAWNWRRRIKSRPSKKVSLKLFNPKVQAGSILKEAGTSPPFWTSCCIMNHQHSKSFTVQSGSETLPFFLFISTSWDFYEVWQKAQKRSATRGTLDFFVSTVPFQRMLQKPQVKGKKRNMEEPESFHQALSWGSCIPCVRAMNASLPHAVKGAGSAGTALKNKLIKAAEKRVNEASQEMKGFGDWAFPIF